LNSARVHEPLTLRRYVSSVEVAAYFDLDGTLLDASSEKTLMGVLLKRRPWRFPLTVSMWSMRCIGSLLIGRTWYDSARNRGHFTFSSWKELEAMAEEIVNNKLANKVPQESIDRIAWHKEQGHRIVIVSATIAPMAEAMGRFLGADTVHASGPLSRTGRLSGSEKGWKVPRNKGKISIVKKDAEENGHDLSKCWAYGNSHADIHFMTICGNAMAVNPDSGLSKRADQEGWEKVSWKISPLQ